MKTYGGMDVYIHIFLTSALAEGEWSAPRTCRFNSRGKSSQDPLDKRVGGPQSRSGRSGEEKTLDPTGN
jgi:hypothetical protein